MPIETRPGVVGPGARPPQYPTPPGYVPPPIGTPQPRPGTGASNLTPPGSQPVRPMPSEAPMQGFDGFFGFFLLLMGMK